MASHAAHPHEHPRHPHRPLAAIVFAFVFVLAFYCRRDPATWLHIQTGARIARERALPAVDTFSYTAAGRPWTTSSWLADWLLHQAHSRVGPLGVVAAQAVSAGLGFALLVSVSSASPIVSAAVLAACAWAGWAGLGLVPGCFDLALAALMMRVLRPHRRLTWTALAWVALIELAWANLNGPTAVLGVWLAALKSVEAVFKPAPGARLKHWTALLLAFAAWTMNPQGAGLLPSILSLSDAQTPAWAFSWTGLSGLIALAGGAAMWICLQQEFFLTLTAASFLALALVFPAMTAVALLSVAPIITLALGHFMHPIRATKGRVARLALALGVLAAWHWRQSRGAWEPADPYAGRSWQGAVAYLKANGLTGRVFNEVEAGDALIGMEGRPVFVDGRAQLYGGSFMKDAALWPSRFHFLDAVYRFDYAVLRNRRASYPARALDDGPWQLAYADDAALVYVKKGGPNAASRPALPTLRPNRLWPDHLLGRLSSAAGAAKALQELDQWIVLAPDSAQPLLWKAYVLDKLGMAEKAARLIAVARANPRLAWDGELKACLAFVLEARADEAAAALYRQAARRAKRRGDAALQAAVLERLSGIARARGRLDEARALERRAEAVLEARARREET